MKNMIAIAGLVAVAGTANAQDLLAFWNFNNTENTGAGFQHQTTTNFFDDGFYDQANGLLYPVTDTFNGNPGALIDPSAWDSGTGTTGNGIGAAINVSGLVGDNFSSSTSQNWGSFGGTSANMPIGSFAGGSLTMNGDANNGSFFVVEADLSLYEDIQISWANRGTSTGYDSRIVEISTDGSSFTQVYSDFGSLSSSWGVESVDFGTALDGASTAFIRFTVDGASSSNGNNRFDNIVLEGTLIPAPGAVALMGLAGLAGIRRRRA